MSQVSSTSGAGASSKCFGGSPDGVCDVSVKEDCDCEDCAMTALCVPDYCNENGHCDLVTDSCVCEDCDDDFVCADPAKYNCVDDGVCDTLSYFEGGGEGCICADCLDTPQCADNVMACNGMMPDAACDTGESCLCPDCAGTVACATCKDDGKCDSNEGCFCADCANVPPCSPATKCKNDMICAPLYEACSCDDCAGIPECLGAGGAGGGG